MRIRIAVPEEHVDASVVDAALEAVTRLDESLIRSGQSPTSTELVAKGAKWRPEPPGDEHFDHGATIAQRGWGDCDDWAPIHAATLRTSGEDPGAFARIVPSGPSTYHAIVQRSDGSIDDPSVAAGMRPLSNPISVIGEGPIDIRACDPHDGRIYAGSLLPTVGPMSLHCGPQMSVRTSGPGFEGRCDMPMAGSRLLGMRRRARRRVVGGQVPYAFSSTALGSSPEEALCNAITGAVLCGDASEMVTSVDRYKLLAVQAKLTGMHPAYVQQALIDRILTDVTREGQHRGVDPHAILTSMAHALRVQPTIHEIASTIVSGCMQGCAP